MTNLELLQALTPNICRSHGVDPNDIQACLELAKELNSSNSISSFLETDRFIRKENILNFIKYTKNTDQQICFQCNGEGKFYVKVGSFGTGECENPYIYSNDGILIYSAGRMMGTKLDNFKYATHLANIMNYILNQTKGLGTATPIFTEEPGLYNDLWKQAERDKEIGNVWERFEEEGIVDKGFYSATSGSLGYSCEGRGYTGYYRSAIVASSSDQCAVWW